MWPNQHAKEAPVSCGWTQERLLGYLDGGLAPRETQRLRVHLEGCPACRQELALCRRSENLLSSALSTAPPAGDLRPGFYARLAASSPSPRRPAWSGWIAVPMLAGVALAIVLFLPRFLSSFRPVAGVTPVSRPPVAVADHHKTALAFLLAPLPSPTPEASPSEHHPSRLRTAGEAHASPERIVYRHPRNARLAYTRRNPLAWVALYTKPERWRTYATKTAAARWEAKASKQVALANTQSADTSQESRAETTGVKLTSAEDEVNFSVRDDVRGFTAGTHVSSLPAASDGDHVVIIEEKSDSLSPSEGDGASADY